MNDLVKASGWQLDDGKVERDGCIAVLYSPGYGAGWSTWNSAYGKEMVFCPRLVYAVLRESEESPHAVAAELFPNAYAGGVEGLRVEWVHKGSRFEITEYDGYEGIRVFGPDDGFVA